MPVIEIRSPADFDQRVDGSSAADILAVFQSSPEIKKFLLLPGQELKITVNGNEYIFKVGEGCMLICREKAHDPGKYVYEFVQKTPENILGVGAQGIVYRTVTKGKKISGGSGKGNVIKHSVPKEGMRGESLAGMENEIDLSRIAHPFFPPKPFFIEQKGLREYFIVMKNFEGQTLQQFMYGDPVRDIAVVNQADIKRIYSFRTNVNEYGPQWKALSRVDLLTIAVNVLKAIRELHERGIIHRDLKPANVMIDKEYNIFLIDFGLSKKNFSVVMESVGTPVYAPKEQARGFFSDEKSDVFAAGIILGQLFQASPSTLLRPCPVTDRQKFKESLDKDTSFVINQKTFPFDDSDGKAIMMYLEAMTKAKNEERIDLGAVISQFDQMLIREKNRLIDQQIVSKIIAAYGLGEQRRKEYLDCFSREKLNVEEKKNLSLKTTLENIILQSVPENKQEIEAYLNALGINALIGLESAKAIQLKIDEICNGFENAFDQFFNRFIQYDTIKPTIRSLYQISVYALCENKTLKNISRFFIQNAARGDYHHPSLDDCINLTKKWMKAARKYDEFITKEIPFGQHEQCNKLKINIINAIKKQIDNDSPTFFAPKQSMDAASEHGRQSVKKMYDLLMNKDVTLDDLRNSMTDIINDMEGRFSKNKKNNLFYTHEVSNLAHCVREALTEGSQPPVLSINSGI